MHLIVGLGNPGAKYEATRHNIGFMVIDRLAERWRCPTQRLDHHALITRSQTPVAILAKPQTFMNRSGDSVQTLMAYYKIPLSHLLVVHDDIDQGYLGLRLQMGRGHGGHNGIRDIHRALATPDYARLKLGVGRPARPEISVSDYVLADFALSERKSLAAFIDEAADAVTVFIDEGFATAATRYNRAAPVKNGEPDKGEAE